MPVISLKDIKKIYTLGDNEVHALRGISLDIEAGEFVSIVGPSGSGKSTMMHILGCLDRPTSGQYCLDDKDVSSLSGDELADIRNKRIGFVFQGFNLLPRTTAAENVEIPLLYSRPVMGATERHERAMKALEVVGLGDRAEHGSNQLSGGQQQRVAIARALVNTPSLILADEPTGNLDTKTSIDVMHVLQDLRERLGITIVLITHEPEIAAYGTRIITVRDGAILSDEANVPHEGLAEPVAAQMLG
ncbi:ABC transporter ATP-binding protein [Croceicoccus mobilis]|uniref:Macrolide ABC transporter ATP-binding protein n=1 Tax=Croceicoccus mobilis TaxID=1703339 RepID=A0A916YX76_9SPHN|nr:ABC transporter ATP-binding protein [Croceicoccus mobilis]GGD65890.1 macrolide ABC transporter ATP-binding protein [Croceicoccus mobilis]